MPIAGPASQPHAARNLEAGMLLIGLGAILLFISLWLTWYQPEVDAWEAFEVWDLVLALLAIAALVAGAGRLGFGPYRPSSWLLVPAVASLVIVLYALLNPPPLVRGSVDGDPDTGLWLALAASVLMAAGALLSVARISVAFAPGDHGAGGPGSHSSGGRFGRESGPAAGGPMVHEPGARGAGPVVGHPGDHGAAPDAVTPTEPTRRL